MVQLLRSHVEHFVGSYDEALQRSARVLSSARPRDNLQMITWALCFRARTLLSLGLVDDAVEALGEARRSLLAPGTDAVSVLTCYGLLAKALALQGNVDDALFAAREVERLVDTAQATSFLSAYGMEGVLEANLGRWEHARDARRSPEAREAARRVERACAGLRSLARTFPVVGPVAWRAAGRARALDGDPAGAVAALDRSRAVAAALDMPFDEALAHEDLARHASSVEARASHDDRARALRARLGYMAGRPRPASLEP